MNTGEVVAGDPSAGPAARHRRRRERRRAARAGRGAGRDPARRADLPARPGRRRRRARRAARAQGQGRAVAGVPARRGRVADARATRATSTRRSSGGSGSSSCSQRALERALTERTSHLFTLLGPAGVGKSRLVQEFLAGSRRRRTVLRGRCLSYGEGITFFPLAEVVQEAAGIAGRTTCRRPRGASSPRSSPTRRDGERIARARRRAPRLGRAGRDRGRVLGGAQAASSTSRANGRSSSCSTTSTGPSRPSST